MEYIQINEECGYFSSAVNIGYIRHGGQGLLIDSGIDKSAAKKVLKHLDAENLPADHLLVTHGHVDHYGGAAVLKRERGLKVHAPLLENAFLEYPVLEPIYLWNGAFPLSELRNKFLEGEAVQPDRLLQEGTADFGAIQLELVSLPGHSYAQLAPLYKGILFAGDAYFGTETLNKHIVPFIVDANGALSSLERLRCMQLTGAVPGHGEFENDISATLQANIECHAKLKEDIMLDVQKLPEGAGMHELMMRWYERNSLSARNIGSWLLYRTSFTAYITSLAEDRRISVTLTNGEPWISAYMDDAQ